MHLQETFRKTGPAARVLRLPGRKARGTKGRSTGNTQKCRCLVVRGSRITAGYFFFCQIFP